MSVACELCFHHCKLEEGQAGACQDVVIVPLNYGKLTSLALDPIEKKPLWQFHLGSMIFRGQLWLQPALPFLPEP